MHILWRQKKLEGNRTLNFVWSNRPKLATRPQFWDKLVLGQVLRRDQTSKIEKNHRISRAPSGRWSSYSTVSKYSPVLQNCKVWASSDHWWWRYTTFKFSQCWRSEHLTLTVPWLLYNDNAGKCCWIHEKMHVMYLHHQCSDEAHTLQFCSTGEYFETVEYELHRPLGARDSWWFLPNSQVWSSLHTRLGDQFISNLSGILNLQRIDH